MTRVAAVAALVILLLPGAGSARGEATFCVGISACAGRSFGSLQRALTAAAATPETDTILLGPGTFRENAAVLAGNPVEIRGAGADRTTLVPQVLSAPALAVQEPASRVTALAIRLPVGAAGGLFLNGGTADGIQVIGEPGLNRSIGVQIGSFNSRFVNGLISMPLAATTAPNYGISVLGPGTHAIDSSNISASYGVRVDGGTVTVTHTRIQASVGLALYGIVATGELRAYDDLVTIVGSGPNLFGVDVRTAVAGVGVVRVRHVTIAGIVNGATGAFVLAQAPGASTVASIADSILWGPGMIAFNRNATNGGSSRLEVNDSDFPRTFVNNSVPGSSGSLALGSTNASSDPRFVGDSDFHLRPDSPLVDRGNPNRALAPDEPPTDVAGSNRFFDGDRDGVARRDLGAYEIAVVPSRVIKVGNARKNRIRGTRRDDALYGRAGDDIVRGGDGNDWLYGGRGRDQLLGGGGDDELFGSDGARDLLDCGAGRDVAFADARDTVRNCETVEPLPFRFPPVPARGDSLPLPELPALTPLPQPVISPPLSPSLSIKKDESRKPARYTITGNGWDKCQNDVVLTNITTGQAIGTPDPDTSGNFTFTTDDLKKGDVVRGEELLCDGAGDTITAEAETP
jgi:Ca2+-binding RTX toxin-like protein